MSRCGSRFLSAAVTTESASPSRSLSVFLSRGVGARLASPLVFARSGVFALFLAIVYCWLRLLLAREVLWGMLDDQHVAAKILGRFLDGPAAVVELHVRLSSLALGHLHQPVEQLVAIGLVNVADRCRHLTQIPQEDVAPLALLPHLQATAQVHAQLAPHCLQA